MRTRSDFIDWCNKKWPEFFIYTELDNKTIYGGPLMKDCMELTEAQVKYLDDKRTFKFEEDWDELTKYTEGFVQACFKDLFYYLDKYLIPIKQYLKETSKVDKIDYNWFYKKGLYNVEDDLEDCLNLWESAIESNIEIKVRNLSDIDNITEFRQYLGRIRKGEPKFLGQKLGELNLTI